MELGMYRGCPGVTGRFQNVNICLHLLPNKSKKMIHLTNDYKQWVKDKIETNMYSAVIFCEDAKHMNYKSCFKPVKCA